VVPQSAVIRTGERSIIFVGLGDGRFDPREVTLGIHGEGDSIQVLSGIREGEMVVTQAQFMLDSESRIQEAIAKYRARGEGKPDGPEPGHPEHLD
jgi:Cu(I)/Ag(I) efflux system membrane fusion protein/cobalt-zinc-cadmium efflux system membrane fusion protein